MITTRDNTNHLAIDLGDGLVLRRSNAEDAQALSDFNALVHSDQGPENPEMRVWAWVNDLMVKPHPTFNPCDFTIVEQVGSGKIVSSMNLISQTWTYAGIPFKVGRPELVGTLPEYRNQGLVRRQFEVIHQWSADKGEVVQVITGIPYYYRLFGYEMAMNLGGGRAGFPLHIPRLNEGEAEPFNIRPAVEADIPFIVRLYDLGCQRSLVACVWDEALWRYELVVKSQKHVNRVEVRLVETADGKPCGFFTHPLFSWGEMMPVQTYEIDPACSWREVTPSVIRYLEKEYEHTSPEYGDKKPFGAFGFWLGEEHPVYRIMPDKLPRVRKPYAWYLRLANIPDFIHCITPILDERLAGSPLAGYSGEIKITFYRDGLRLVFEKGQLVCSEAWKPTPVGGTGDAAFPPHTFLQLLFGYRSMEHLKDSFVDCWTSKDEIHVLLDSLFPRQPSNVWPIS